MCWCRNDLSIVPAADRRQIWRVRRRHRGRQRSVLAWALECSVVDQRRSGGSVEDNRFGAAWEFGHLARSFHCAGATSPSHVARAGIARECIDSENGMIPIARLHLGSRSFSSRYVDANTTDRTRFLADVRVGAEGRIRTVTRARFTKRLRACNKTLRNLILGPRGSVTGMATALLPDALWNLVEPFRLPSQPPGRSPPLAMLGSFSCL